MMTQASTTFWCKRSFSVHVEMYERGSAAFGRRSSFTSCCKRMGLVGRSDREKLEDSQHVQGDRRRRRLADHGPDVCEEGVNDVDDEPESDKADPTPRVLMMMDEGPRREGGHAGDRFLDRERGCFTGRRCLWLGQVGGGVAAARVAPPPRVHRDPPEFRAAIRAGEFR